MDVYRIAYRMFANSPLDGEGSFLYGGRWSSPGVRVAYTSTTMTLAMAEFLAHGNTNDFDPDTPPELVYVRATLPKSAVRSLDEIGATLPPGWDEVPAPAVDIAVGNAWIHSSRSLGLLVPSVHVPIETPERNVLINPLHRGFAQVTWIMNEFSYDRRLLGPRVVSSRRTRKSLR